MFRKYPTAAHYARAKLPELERDIQSTGFFRNKAKSIQNCCRVLLERYDGEVPKDIDTLVELPGIGRKTANVVLGTAYGIAVGVVVDTHVARISRRLGLSHAERARKNREGSDGAVCREEWIALSHRLIHHGRRCCTARNPKCDECPLLSLCPRIGVEK